MDGRCRAAVRGQDPLDPVDPLDPRMGSFLRALGIKTMKMNIGNRTHIFYIVFSMFVVIVFVVHVHCVLQ